MSAKFRSLLVINMVERRETLRSILTEENILKSRRPHRFLSVYC